MLSEVDLQLIERRIAKWHKYWPGITHHAECGEKHSICLAEKLLAEVKALRKVAEAAEAANDFGLDWAIAHQKDDHMVTMDHKDETALADLVADLCKALAAYQEAGR